jgi:hypothetical protein
MKSFIEFLEENTLNEANAKQVIDVMRAFGGAFRRVGPSALVKNIAGAGEEKLASMLKNFKGPGVQGTGNELSTTGPAKTGELLPRQSTSNVPALAQQTVNKALPAPQTTTSNLPNVIPPKTYTPVEPTAQTTTKTLVAPETATKTDTKTLVAPETSTKTDTKTLVAPETSTKTDTKSITPTKPPEPPKPPKPPIGQEPIPPKPFGLPNWVLGKSGFLSQNPGFIPSIKGHGRFYSP